MNWELAVSFRIDGEPVAKQRPRFSRKNMTAYTPAKTVAFEKRIKTIAENAISAPLSGVIRLCLTFNFSVRKSWPRKKRENLNNCYHIQRPDLDNLVKTVSDALNEVAFFDDCQIACIEAQKLWSNAASIDVIIYREREKL
jgi:Holliday junction resolvase RusA-like endonuclease